VLVLQPITCIKQLHIHVQSFCRAFGVKEMEVKMEGNCGFQLDVRDYAGIMGAFVLLVRIFKLVPLPIARFLASLGLVSILLLDVVSPV
jgi:hypothetical protein